MVMMTSPSRGRRLGVVEGGCRGSGVAVRAPRLAPEPPGQAVRPEHETRWRWCRAPWNCAAPCACTRQSCTRTRRGLVHNHGRRTGSRFGDKLVSLGQYIDSISKVFKKSKSLPRENRVTVSMYMAQTSILTTAHILYNTYEV